MLDQIFRNMTPVVKNLLILNVLFFIATFILQTKGIDLINLLSSRHYSNPDFRPYQLITGMFMHAGFLHLLMNMLALVSLGSILEQNWGASKFLIFYFVSGFSAEILQVLYNTIAFYYYTGFFNIDMGSLYPEEVIGNISRIYFTKHLGASGAIFGILSAFYKYYPNTEMNIMFIPYPIKMKYLFPGLIIISIILVFFPMVINIGHVAHLGGALGGYILVLFWQKDKRNFY